MYIRNPETNEWEEVFLPPTGDTLPIGSISAYGGENIPTNWLKCNGQALLRTDYPELFNTIGTTYGSGDGSTTFNLPNISERVIVGNNGDGEFSLGNTGGEKAHTLTVQEMPSHNHDFNKAGVTAMVSGGSYDISQQSGSRTYDYISIKNTGGGQAHNNLQPYIALNYIIKAKQSVGVVGTVTSDINDINDNAVPNAKTVKDYVEEVYSTSEVKTNKVWIDGKPIYKKVIDFGTLPNNSTKTIPTGLDHKEINLIALYGIAKDSNGTQFAINQSRTNGLNSQIGTYLNSSNELVIEVGTDRSNFSAFVTLEYTKTTL